MRKWGPACTPIRGPHSEPIDKLSSERRRFGYRRLHILLRREGWEVNWKKLYRIYREERLTVRKRGGRKRALGKRAPMAIPQGPNQRWSLDFVSDALACGRRFRVLCVIDDFSRECQPEQAGKPWAERSSEIVSLEIVSLGGHVGSPSAAPSPLGRVLAAFGPAKGRCLLHSDSPTESGPPEKCATAEDNDQ